MREPAARGRRRAVGSDISHERAHVYLLAVFSIACKQSIACMRPRLFMSGLAVDEWIKLVVELIVGWPHNYRIVVVSLVSCE